MKKFLVVLLTMSSISSFSSEILNQDRTKSLKAECVSFNSENKCNHYEIKFQGKLILNYFLAERVVTSADELRTIQQSTNKDGFIFFPVTKKFWKSLRDVNDNSIFPQVVAGAAEVVGGTGLFFTFFGLVPEGPIVLAVAGGILSTPTLVDIVSLPVRGAIRGIKYVAKRKTANQSAEALSFLTNENSGEMILSDKKFRKVVKYLMLSAGNI